MITCVPSSYQGRDCAQALIVYQGAFENKSKKKENETNILNTLFLYVLLKLRKTRGKTLGCILQCLASGLVDIAIPK